MSNAIQLLQARGFDFFVFLFVFCHGLRVSRMKTRPCSHKLCILSKEWFKIVAFIDSS